MSMPPPPSAPPPPPFGGAPGSALPPGYTPYGAGAPSGQVRPSAGLSKAMIILFWCTTAASALFGFALFQRHSAWDDASPTFDDLQSADNLVGGTSILQILLILASAIVTCLWAKRIADNAKARGAVGVSPGMAAGGWFIPIGNLWLGFSELRKSGRPFNAALGAIGVWQGMYIAGGALNGVTRSIVSNNVDNLDSLEDLKSKLQAQGFLGILCAICFAAATVYAAKAAKALNTAVTGG